MKINLFIAFKIWLTAQIIYLAINIVALPMLRFSPGIVFLYSEAFAIGCGLPALALFATGFHLFKIYCRSVPAQAVIIGSTGIIITFLATLLAANLFSGNSFWDAWQDNVEFPLCGLLSAAISLLSYRKHITASNLASIKQFSA